jgi:CheY-like chemotaxis protein
VAGFDVIEASSAEEGLRLARAELPDVIVLDLVMPGMGGSDFLAELRADQVTCRIPVVIATGATLDDEEARSLLRYATAIVFKSELSGRSLPAAVRQALQRAI